MAKGKKGVKVSTAKAMKRKGYERKSIARGSAWHWVKKK